MCYIGKETKLGLEVLGSHPDYATFTAESQQVRQSPFLGLSLLIAKLRRWVRCCSGLFQMEMHLH